MGRKYLNSHIFWTVKSYPRSSYHVQVYIQGYTYVWIQDVTISTRKYIQYKQFQLIIKTTLAFNYFITSVFAWLDAAPLIVVACRGPTIDCGNNDLNIVFLYRMVVVAALIFGTKVCNKAAIFNQVNTVTIYLIMVIQNFSSQNW